MCDTVSMGTQLPRRTFFAGFLAFLPGAAVAREWVCKRWTTAEQFGFYAPPTRRTVTLRVAFLDEQPPEMRTKACRGGSGCYLKGTGGQPDLVMVPRPQDFADERALYVLGHEVLHALGAQHG